MLVKTMDDEKPGLRSTWRESMTLVATWVAVLVIFWALIIFALIEIL
jgi:hypothetical protein